MKYPVQAVVTIIAFLLAIATGTFLYYFTLSPFYSCFFALGIIGIRAFVGIFLGSPRNYPIIIGVVEGILFFFFFLFFIPFVKGL